MVRLQPNSPDIFLKSSCTESDTAHCNSFARWWRCGHARAVHSVVDLIASVDAAFVETGRGLAGWEDPHPDRRPLEEEYSRLTNPQKWRILRARAEAWLKALDVGGLAEIDPDAAVVWEEQPRVDVVGVQRASPLGSGAIPLTFAWTRFDGATGVVIGVGDPTVVVEVLPDCGCDACDSGSQDALNELDEYVLGVVTGEYRRLRRGKREIIVYAHDRQGWSGFDGPWENLWRFVPSRDELVPRQPARVNRKRAFRLPRALLRYFASSRLDRQVEQALAHPKGWHEVSGSSWLNSDNLR